MTPHRTRGDRGHLRFDRWFPEPVRRINCSSQTSDANLFTRRNEILDELWADGQIDVLLEIKRGRKCQISWGEIARAKKQGRLSSATLMADIKLRRRLWDVERDGRTIAGAVSRAIDAMDCAESTKDRYRLSWQQLRELTRTTEPPIVRVRHLARVNFNTLMRAYDSTAANKNRMRAAVSATLTQLLDDKFHPFRRQIIHPKHWKPAKETPSPKEITAEEFWELMQRLPAEIVDACVTLAASGMRVGEYLADAHIRINARRHVIETTGKTGEKTYAVAPSLWEYVARAVPCRVAKRRTGKGTPRRIQDDPRYKRLWRELRAAGQAMDPPLEVSPHYLRHLYVQLGVDTVGETRTQHAVGHKTPGMTRDYARRKDQGAVAQSIADALTKPITPKTPKRKRA